MPDECVVRVVLVGRGGDAVDEDRERGDTVVRAGDSRNAADELRLANSGDPAGIDEARLALRRGADDFADQGLPADEGAGSGRSCGCYG